MSTVASARPAAISVPNLNNLQESRIGLPVTTAVSNASASRAFALYRHTTTMHPNDLLLQKHGVTSPRLCNVAEKATIESGSPQHGCSKMSVNGGGQRSEMNEDNEEDMREKDDIAAAEDDHVMIDDDEDEDDDTRRSLLAVAACDEDLVDDKSDDERDAVSLCSSEDSELSVGQEDDPAVEDKNVCKANFLPARRLLLTNVSDMMSLCRPSAFSNVSAGDNGSDARSSVSTDCDATQLDEEQQLQNVRPAAVLDPFTVANALRMPVPLVPPQRTGVGVVPAQFQEELLRKSHLYAEELMKQQMQLMAAARASAFTLRQTVAPTTAISGASFRPQQSTPNYSGIHSHLSAISKMSQLGAAAAAAALAVSNQQNVAAQLGGSDALAKLTAFGMSGGQITQTVASGASSLNQLQAQMQAHLPVAYMNNNNNNNNHLHESSLKFSIDNILKADFGRRITDPLLKRGGGTVNFTPNGILRGSARASNAYRSKKSSGSSAAATTTTPMDLTSQMTAVASSVGSVASNFSTSLANICTNSNDSSSTAVSSTYGGNSDALKSPCSLTGGAASACSVSPAPPFVGGGTEVGSKATQDNAADGNGAASSSSSTSSTSNGGGTGASGSGPIVWPAWVYCTRYSDRPSSGPRARKPKKPASEKGASPPVAEDKRPRTAFSGSQLARLKHEFTESRYLTEKRRQQLSSELGLNEAQIKIWFQNKRAKLKKSSGTKNPLALQLMAQGLYNHSTVPLTREEEELQELQERENAAAAAAAAGTVSS